MIDFACLSCLAYKLYIESLSQGLSSKVTLRSELTNSLYYRLFILLYPEMSDTFHGQENWAASCNSVCIVPRYESCCFINTL